MGALTVVCVASAAVLVYRVLVQSNATVAVAKMEGRYIDGYMF